MATNKTGYLGNPFLKQIGEQIEFTQEQVLEYARCAADPVYFLENYGKIVVLGKGTMPFKLFSYQKRIITAIRENRKVIGRIGRQMGKSTIVAGYFAWFVMFGGTNTKSAILANKLAVAKEIFSRVQFIIENCPKWLQQGVKEWNKTSFILENGSSVFCSATSPSAVRGFSIDNIFCDEFAHLRTNLAEEFIASVFPTLSSSDTTKLIIVSTPKGMNHYYQLYDEAQKGLNGFVSVDAHWSENPGRDQKWLDGQLAELGQLKFRQEVLCVAGETTVTVKIDNTIKTIPISELYEICKSEDPDITHDIEILTPSGFQPFDGIVKKISHTLKLMLSDGSFIRCTPDHRFMVEGAWVVANTLKPKNKIHKNISVVSIRIDADTFVYDPVNVSNGNSYISGSVVSHNCDFLGSSSTLLSGDALRALSRSVPTSLLPNQTLLQYQEPQKGHSYVMCVDTARGKGLDYSTFQIIDISVLPYKIVCTYRDNNISTLVFPEVIARIAEMYNDSFVLIETNDLGQQVADILFYDLEYENVYMSSSDDIKEGGGRGSSPGLRTTKRTKAIGCDMLKNLIENDKLEVNDGETINEFTTFIRVGNTYKAEEGKHDDMVMPLVMFGYLTTQPVFKDLFDFSLREKFFAAQLQELEDQMLPLGYVDRGDVVVEVPVYSGRGWVEGHDDSFKF